MKADVMSHKLAVIMILLFVLTLSACTQNRGGRGGVRGSRTGNFDIEDIDRTHQDIRTDYEKEQEENRRKQQELDDNSYGY